MDITKRRLFVANNLFIFVMTAVMVTITLTFGSWAARKDNGPFTYWQHVVTFTILSNIFLGIVALVAAIIGHKRAKTNRPLPRKLLTWYLIATTSGMLTCLTVVFFLAPVRAASGKDYFDMVLGPMFFLHFFDPILAAITYIFLSGKSRTATKDRFLSMLPPIIYAAPYIICVAIIHIWPDFYGLTFGGRYYLLFFVAIAFLFIVFGISSMLAFFHNKCASKSSKSLDASVEKSLDT